MRYLDGLTDSMDSLSKLQEMAKDGEAWRCSPWSHRAGHDLTRLNDSRDRIKLNHLVCNLLAVCSSQTDKTLTTPSFPDVMWMTVKWSTGGLESENEVNPTPSSQVRKLRQR